MTIDEMFNELENKARDTYIVTLKYKYEFEENYTIENQILEYDSITDSYVWLNDWNERQTDVEVLGYMILGDVDTTKVEPCDDSISRTDLIAVMHLIMDDAKIGDNDEDYESLDDIKQQYIEIVKGMVSVKPEVKWIPVSERLPKNHENVLIYLSSNQITIGLYNSHILPFRDKPIGWGADAPHDWTSDEVIAWMPLPEPYKEESEDK